MVTANAGRWKGLPVDSRVQLAPGFVVYRFTHSTYYASAGLLSDQILDLVNNSGPAPSWLRVDAEAVDNVAFTSAQTLRSLCGSGAYFDSVADVLFAYGT